MSSITGEKAVITLEVELVSSVTGLEQSELPSPEPFLSDLPDDIREIIKEAVDESIKEAVEETLDDEGVDLDGLKNLTDVINDIDSQGVSTLKSLAKSPETYLENQFMGILGRAGPYGALAAALLTVALSSPELVRALVEAFAVKGAPLNQDYRYSQEEFLSQEFDRITQFKRLVGDDPVITVNTVGFVVGDPDFKGNSLVDANVARSGRVGLRDSSYGYIHGL